MERYFILDKFNTWFDFHSIITDKDIPDPEPNTNYVKLDGMDGSLDLSESLTGEVTYSDRTLTASFWTDYGKRKDREELLRRVSSSLHGKKVQIIEPDDSEHYLLGRIKVKGKKNNLAYATYGIEAVCEPWRYSLTETVRRISVNSDDMVDFIFRNTGVKTVTPVITVEGDVNITCGENSVSLGTGSYKVSDIKLYQGTNIISVSGSGTVTFTYREATL